MQCPLPEGGDELVVGVGDGLADVEDVDGPGVGGGEEAGGEPVIGDGAGVGVGAGCAPALGLVSTTTAGPVLATCDGPPPVRRGSPGLAVGLFVADSC
jgi:hypothetical protein